MNRHLNCILLIDDDRATNFLNKRLLSKMDVSKQVKIARNGAEALDYMARATDGVEGYPWPELILLDINMPLVNGWEFLEKYKLLPERVRRSTIILMLTTSLREEDEFRAQSTSLIKGYIKKPLSQQDLERVIAEHFVALAAANP